MINEIQGQPVSFTDQYCGDYCLTLANNAICGDYVDNPTFLGDPVNDWSVNNGTQTGERTFTDLASVELRQTISLPIGSYRLFYKVETDTNNWSGTLQLTGLSTSGTLFSSSTNFVESGVLDFTVGSGTNRTCDFLLSFGSPTQVITTHYFYICERDAFVPENDFCFQMPLFDTGSNLLSLTSNSVRLLEGFTDTSNYTKVVDSSPATCGTPSTVQNHFAGSVPTATNSPTADGEYFIRYKWADVQIDYSEDADETLRRLPIRARNGGLTTDSDYYILSESAADTEVIFLDSNTWSTTDDVDVWYNAYTSCDGTNERVKFDVDLDEFEMLGNFQETTFTAEDDTFYRLTYNHAKTTQSTVKVYDSASTLIYQSDADPVGFDGVFLTGTLPTTTVTVRFEVYDLTDFPNANYELNVIDSVSLKKQCKYDVWIETEGEIFVQNLTEDHDFTTEAAGKTYNQNIEYCLDVNTIAPGKYQLRALNDCDGTEVYISNQIYVCGASCDGLNQFSYTPTAVKCIGDQVLDYVAYPSTQFFWLKLDLQDLTMDDERVAYRQSDGFWNVAYAINQSAETLQVWPVPAFLRKAIANGMQDTFMIDGVEYQKIEEDDYSVQFSARHDNAMRIVVSRVGDFSISRNV